MHRLIFCVVFLLVVATTATTIAQVDQPPAGYTDKDYRRDRDIFIRKYVIEPYEEHTKDRGQVRKKVLRFLEGYNDFLSRDAIDRATLSKLEKEARKTGSQDPQFLAHVCYSMLEHKPSFVRMAKTALAALEGSPYPAFTRLKVRIWQLRYANPKRRKDLIEDLKKQLLIVFKETEYPDQRFIWIIAYDASFCEADELRDLVSTVEGAKDIDPWLKSMFLGRLKRAIGWKARGQDYAHKVPEKAWKTFYSFLDEAQVEFENAMGIQPDFPEAAGEMISIAMEQRESKKSPRDYFEAATAAQFDWVGAYSHLLRTLEPRWGGSVGETVAFGIECAETERFDTDVPWYLFVDIISRRKNGEKPFENLDIYPTAVKVCKGYAARAAKEGDIGKVRKYESYLAASALLAKKPEDVVAALERIDNKIDEKAFEAMLVKGTGLLARSVVRASPAAELCEEVQQAIMAGGADLDDFAQKVDQLKAVREKVPQNGRSFVDGLIDQLNAVLAFENGEWADIKFDKDLSQWGERGIANGKKKWKAEPSTNSVLFSGTECQRLEWYYPVDQPYVVEVSVEVVKHERSYASKLAGVVAGDYFRGGKDKKGTLLHIEGGSNYAGYIDSAGRAFANLSASTKVRRLRVHAWEKFYMMSVNGRFCMVKQDDGFDPTGPVGVGGICVNRGNRGNQTVRYSNFRIRKLNFGPPVEDLADPVKYWSHWLKAEPDYAYVLYKRGKALAFESADNLDAAIEDLVASIKLDPHELRSYVVLAALYQEKAQFDKAKATYLKALENSGQLAVREKSGIIEPLTKLEACCSDETVRDGQAALKRAMLLNKEFPNRRAIDTMVASAWATIGDFDKAVQWQQKAVEAEPDSPVLEARQERLSLYKAKKPFVYPPGPRTLISRKIDKPKPPKVFNLAVTKGLVARWPFDTDINDTVNELESKAVNGVVKPRSLGKVNQAVTFLGNKYVSTPNFEDFRGQFSFGGWISTNRGGGTILSQVDKETDCSHKVGLLKKSGTIEFQLFAGGPRSDKIVVKTEAEIALRKWQHFFITYDGSSKADGVKIYINGTQVKTVAVRDKLSRKIRNNAPFNIGEYSDEYEFFRGQVDELRVYDRTLSPEEVAKVVKFGNEPAAATSK